MAEEVLVKQIQEVVREVRALEGPIALFMLLSSDFGNEDRWNILVSAKGFDSKSPAVATNELTKILRRNVKKSMWSQITRATVLQTDDPFVLAMNKAFRAEQSVVTLQSCNVLGISIERALLFESRRIAA